MTTQAQCQRSDRTRAGLRARLLGSTLQSWPQWIESLGAEGDDGVATAWREALVPGRRFTSRAERSVWEAITEWLAHDRQAGLVLLLSGTVGTGKSWLLRNGDGAHPGRVRLAYDVLAARMTGFEADTLRAAAASLAFTDARTLRTEALTA